MRPPWLVLPLLALAFAFASPATAAVRSVTCDAEWQAHGACSPAQAGDTIIVYLFGYSTAPAPASQCPGCPLSPHARMVRACGETWLAEVLCTQDLVDATVCTVEDLGNLVPNPRTRRQEASRQINQMIRERIRRFEDQEARRMLVEPDDVDADGDP